MMKLPPYSVSNYVQENVSRRWFSTSQKGRPFVNKVGHFFAKHLIFRVSSVALPAFALLVDLPGNLVLGTLKGASYRFTKDPDLSTLRKGMVKEHYKASGQAAVNFLKSVALIIPNLLHPGFSFKDFRKHNPEKLKEKPHIITEGAIRREKAYEKKIARRLARRRKESELKRKNEVEEKQRQHTAATKIQSAFRGFRVRKAMERDLESFVQKERKREIREYLASLPAVLKQIREEEQRLAGKNDENSQNIFFNTHNPAFLIAEYSQRTEPHIRQIEEGNNLFPLS